jgi:hypothetical protein
MMAQYGKRAEKYSARSCGLTPDDRVTKTTTDAWEGASMNAVSRTFDRRVAGGAIAAMADHPAGRRSHAHARIVARPREWLAANLSGKQGPPLDWLLSRFPAIRP